MALPLIPLGIAAARAAGPAVARALAKRRLKKRNRKPRKPAKEPSISSPSGLTKNRGLGKKSDALSDAAEKKAKAARTAKRRKSATKLAASTAGLAAVEELLSGEKKSKDTPKVEKGRTSPKAVRKRKDPVAGRPKRRPTKAASRPTVKTKTGQQRAEDASRKKVPVTRVSDAKATKRFVDRDKAKKLKTPLQPPVTPKQKAKDTRKKNMAAAKKQSRKADVPMPTTVAAGQKRAQARGENRLAGTFKRVEQDKAAPGKKTAKFVDKAAVTREDLDAWRARTGNEDLGYKESLRGLLNEARGLTRRGAKAGGAVKKFNSGGNVSVRGAGIAQRGVRPCKMR
tara:strand:- start:6000 stop:7022 length:1023 start_codon:yes stop_codon:yes gene_type:complete